MPESPEKVLLATRSELTGTEIDFSGDSVRYKTITGNTTFTIVNPLLDRVVIIQIDGNFSVTLPGTVTVINGDYLQTKTNFLYLHCIDSATPLYLASWGVAI